MRAVLPSHFVIIVATLSGMLGVVGCEPTAPTVTPNPVGTYPEQCGTNFVGMLRTMNGRSLQGMGASPGTVTRITKGCVEVSNLHLEKGTLVGTLSGLPMRGADFVSTTVTQVDTNGNGSISVISAVDVDLTDPTGETLLYSLKTQRAGDSQLSDVCAVDAMGRSAAVAVPGTWDATGAHQSSTSKFSFGCTSAAIGKCVGMGYRPWAQYAGSSLEGYHQACTRMVRFDYCGDGNAHTIDGTEIDVYDLLGLNTRDASILNPFDAAWSEDGAYCIERQRWTRLSTTNGVSGQALLPGSCLSRYQLAVAESSPIDLLDVCSSRSKTIPRSAVKLDNRSGINVILQ